MVIRDDGVFEGSVSGGCVEGSVIAEAINLIEADKDGPHSKELSFSVASEQAWEVGLACGGEINVWLLVLKANDITPLMHALDLQSNNKTCELAFGNDTSSIHILELGSPSKKPVPAKQGGQFVVPLIPPLCLDIIGAVHIAQHLALMASECDFKVRVIDPRAAFTEERSFSGVELISEWPDDFFRKHVAGPTTAVVTLTHDPKLDDAALAEALKSNPFYIGCLGSKKTHSARLKRLSELGFSPKDTGRIHGPVGLDISAATPAEIAVSILAEIIREARSL